MIWVLMVLDLDAGQCVGAYSTERQGWKAVRVLWERYQRLTDAQRQAGPLGLLYEEALTWETFLRWHTLVPLAVDALPDTYSVGPPTVAVEAID